MFTRSRSALHRPVSWLPLLHTLRRNAMGGSTPGRSRVFDVLERRTLLNGDGIVQNGISQFDVFVDGLFTGGVQGGVVVGEWSDVTPQGFISPGTPDGPLFRTPPGEPNALTYAAIAPGAGEVEPSDLYLMYDYLPRTNPMFAPGEFIAQVTFPITIDLGAGPQRVPVAAQVVGADPRGETPTGPAQGEQTSQQVVIDSDGDGLPDQFPDSFFDVFVMADSDGDGTFETELFGTGIEGAVGFGPSSLGGGTLPNQPNGHAPIHLLVELEVPLRIEPQADGPFVDGRDGVYSPDPAFWGADLANDTFDPPASFNVISIDPLTGVVTTDTSVVPTLTLFVDELADLVVTFDADASTTVTPGDTVTWAGDPADPGDDVPGLIFGVGAFDTISGAVAAAVADAAVLVAPGMYSENVVIGTSLILAGVTTTAGDVLINPAAGDGIAITPPATSVTLENLRITTTGHGVVATGVDLLANNVESIGNTGHGFSLAGMGQVVMTDVTATGNDPGVLVVGALTFSDVAGTYSGNADHGIALVDIVGSVLLVRTTADDNDADTSGGGSGLIASSSDGCVTPAIGGSLTISGGRFRGVAGVQINGVSVECVAGSVTFQDSAGPAQSVEVTGNSADGVAISSIGVGFASITGGSYSGNGGSGVVLIGFGGGVAVSGVTGNGNGGEGLVVAFSAAASITSSTFSANGGDGFAVGFVPTLTLADLNLGPAPDPNLSGVGGFITVVTTVDFTGTTTPAQDTITVGPSDFQHTRDGVAHQPVVYFGVSNLNLFGTAESDVYGFVGLGFVTAVSVNEAAGCVDQDTLDFAGYGAGVTVDISDTTAQTISPGDLVLTLSSATGIEAVVGTAFDDDITGNTCNNLVSGGDGDDTVDGGSGDDTIDPGAGDDEVAGGLAADVVGAILVGSVFKCTEDGNPGDDTLAGDDGADTLCGGSGEDQLYGGSDDDSLDGGADPDFITGGDGHDKIGGGSGDDFLSGDAGNDSLYGSAGDDILAGGSGNDLLDGGSGSDTAYFASSPAAVEVDLGRNRARGEGSDALPHIENVVGSAFNDKITGDDAPNSLDGFLGNDRIKGKKSNDTLIGGDGNDVIDGDEGDDLISGGDGNDAIAAGSGADLVSGGDGNDDVRGQDGNDVLSGDTDDDKLDGGTGSDVISGGTGEDAIKDPSGDNSIDAGPGDDNVRTGAGRDTIAGGTENDSVSSGAGNDSVDGGDGDDTIRGENGDDTLNGDAGNDSIRGGTGNDLLVGGVGADTLLGEKGNDVLDATIDADLDLLVGGPGLDKFLNLLAGDTEVP